MGVFGAQTWPDGRISMHWLAFVHYAGTRNEPKYVPDPDALAGFIAHETVHWVRAHTRDEISDSRTRIFEAYGGEAAAYAAQAELLRKQGNPSGSEFSDHSKRYFAQARQVTDMPADVTWEDIKRLHPDWLPVGGHGRALPPGVAAPKEPGGIDGLEWARDQSGRSFTESLDSLGELATNARRTADAHATGREAERERERQARRDRLAQDDARYSAAWDYLVATAKLACTDPDSLEDHVRANRVVGADVHSLYLMDRLAKTRESGWSSVGKGLSACQETLINGLIRSRQPVAVYDLLGWARDYRKENPSLGESISGALHEFLDAVGRVSPPNEEPAPSEAARPAQPASPETTSPPREREADRGGIYVKPCMHSDGGGRCIRWR